MSDWFFKQKRNGLINWMGLDSWIDSSLAQTFSALQDRWNAAQSFFARFRLHGTKRIMNELASEALTMGAGGLVVMYALALPAFLEIDEGKALNTGRYAVKFLDRNGKEIGQRGILHNDALALEDIPDYLIKATLATEDRRFFEHFGIDVLGTVRALLENARAGETVQGGSTITQQLAKNLFLSSERSLQRKIKELFLSFWLESRFTKREILKLYLDRAYMGGGAFGVEAAAQFYFGKSVKNVTLAEAAMMAGLFKAPTKFAPHIDLPAARARANEVLTNMVEAGYMTAGQVHAARVNPAKSIDTRTAASPDWFLDWAFEEIQRVAEGRGHYVITARTTIDLNLQQAAEQALVSTIRQKGRSQRATSGAMVAMEPDGAVRALVGGTDYGESQFNRATHARRQPGSSFKLYVYANAIERGLTPKSIVRDHSVSCGNWSPKNYDGGSGGGGSMTAGVAFAKSINTVAVDLSLKYERDRVVEMTRRLGVEGVKKTCSMALGDTGITPLQHTAAYATFANDGILAKPYAILDMYSSRGELIYTRDKDEPPAPRVLSRRVVEQMNQMMQMVVTEGTGRRAQLDYTFTVGKTGTSSGYRDAWFVGFSGQYVTGVWMGNDDYRPMHNVTGGTIPTMAWHSFMSVAHTSMDIPQIPGLPLHPTQIAERQKIEEARRQQVAQRDTSAPSALAAPSTADTQRRSHSLMSDQAREALRRASAALRSASGLPPDPQTAPTSPTEQQQQPRQQPAANRRADGSTGTLSTGASTGASIYTPTAAGDLPAVQGPSSRAKR